MYKIVGGKTLEMESNTTTIYLLAPTIMFYCYIYLKIDKDNMYSRSQLTGTMLDNILVLF